MASIETAKISLLTAPSKPIGHLANLVPAGEIWYDGSNAAGVPVTAATVAHATDTLTLTINGAVDSRIGASGLIDCNDSAYDTYGELSDHINSVDGWHFRLLGPLRADSTDADLNELAAANCFKLPKQLTITTTTIHSYCISNATGTMAAGGSTSFDRKVQAIYDEHGAANCLFYFLYNGTDTGIITMTIYSINGATNTETLLGTFVMTTDTEYSDDFTGMPVTALAGDRLVVRLVAGTSIDSITDSIIVAKSIQM